MSHSHNHTDERPLSLHSLVVQSTSLKHTLAELFAGYQGITPLLQKLVFRAPFHAFHHRWAQLTHILHRQTRDDPAAAAYTQLLVDVLDRELGPLRREIQDMRANRVISYPLLWALFEPGELVVTRRSESESEGDGDEGKGESFFRVVTAAAVQGKERDHFSVRAQFVDWNGKRWGYANRVLNIERFSGTCDIRSLPVYPAVYHPYRAGAEEQAMARGRRFRDLAGFHYMAYAGLMQYWAGVGKMAASVIARNVDGRIVVDADGFMHANPDKAIVLQPLGTAAASPSISVDDDQHLERAGPSRFPRPGRPGREMMSRRPTEQQQDQVAVPDEDQPLTDIDLLLCTSQVRGYSLKHKVWALFDVTLIHEIAWNDTAFSTLMLPTGYKNLILSFVEGQASHRDVFDDVVEGKGQGIIMLLAGSPGTGKTLTAEAIADRVRKPLYMLSAGELGRDAANIERRLSTVLELTEKWDAVLLFDECDVFLQERSSSHLQHNEVVAVFLRVLEYYRGVMIMTSNRADAIDQAFQSRIHLTLHYPDLDPAAREHIWRRGTARAKRQHVLTDEAFQRLAQLAMNGRQIKNTIRIAALLAAQEDTSLGMEQVDTVLLATQRGR
ncbi:P-loop containing nucleoside triphosphate hydrolase protein [Aspergillus ellipticus CBS 707.79]|uniref:P-loop containing nucleoside triphosphate hydrolase protein n=1 Tax=Aspergillus ellipticus CBS 707.79 TaxID=1448320 RepID=A0A319CRH0_9EURO|nr:P-loop containing nucleoside triphosphate hydrolase protein [Aspergillus ellipticus CBS 707.79]